MKQPIQLSTTVCDYLVEGVLGQGGSGVVFSASDKDGERYAIKCLDPQFATRDKLRRFKNELHFCSKTEHPNLIKVIDHGITNDGESFFVMPRFDGSLRSLVGKLAPDAALGVFAKLLDGVEAAHKLNVVHRDIKPENVLIRGNGATLVIADFGIARFEEDNLYTAVETQDGARLANFIYAAPEQKTRGKAVDRRADIYALGLMLNELFTGDVPHGTKFRQVSNSSLEHSYLDPIIDRMLAQEPADRYDSIESIKNELIARGKEFVALQRVSETRKQVVPVTEIDDPIVDDPMRVVGVDWANNALSIELNHNANHDWIWAFNNFGGYTSLMGKAPENFNFRGNKATIGATAADAQKIIDYFKQWLPRANQEYANKLSRDRASVESRRRKELEQRVKAEDERARVLGQLKF